MGAMVLAMQEGVAIAGESFGVPRTTLQNWFKPYGGIGEVGRELEAKARDAGMRARQAVFEAMANKASELRDKQLVEAFGKALGTTAEGGAGPTADAHAESHVWNINLNDNPNA